MYKKIEDISIEELKKNCKMIHYFGLGFIQLKIDNKYRLHFYTDNLPKILAEEEVHNHRYNFTSYILKGNFETKIYKIIDGEKYLLEDEACKKGFERDKSKSKSVDVKMIEYNFYGKGDRYWIDKDVFHRVYGYECITLVERDEPEKEFAQVLTPKTGEKICPFSKKIPEDVLWGIVEVMLKV